MKNIGKAGLMGAAVSGVYGGAFDVMAGGVKAGDVQSVLKDIEATQKKAENQKINNKFTPEKAKQADSQTLGDLRLIEKTLKSVDENKRAELIKNNNLSGLFDADGSLNADYAEVLSKDSIFDRRYYSENQRGREKILTRIYSCTDKNRHTKILRWRNGSKGYPEPKNVFARHNS